MCSPPPPVCVTPSQRPTVTICLLDLSLYTPEPQQNSSKQSMWLVSPHAFQHSPSKYVETGKQWLSRRDLRNGLNGTWESCPTWAWLCAEWRPWWWLVAETSWWRTARSCRGHLLPRSKGKQGFPGTWFTVKLQIPLSFSLRPKKKSIALNVEKL